MDYLFTLRIAGVVRSAELGVNQRRQLVRVGITEEHHPAGLGGDLRQLRTNNHIANSL